MRQILVLCLILSLTGCVSERHFVRDSWPFGNPNAPSGDSEMALRALGQVATVTPIVPQAGDVWPGPVQPMPTLSDMQSKMNLPLGEGYTPSLPSPYPPGQSPPPDALPDTPNPAFSDQPIVPPDQSAPPSAALPGVAPQSIAPPNLAPVPGTNTPAFGTQSGAGPQFSTPVPAGVK